MSLQANLLDKGFNAKKWLEKELNVMGEEQLRKLEEYNLKDSKSEDNDDDIIRQQSVDLQLTEILFNVKFLQQKNQEEMLNAQERVHKNQEQILKKQEEIVDGLCEIEEFLMKSEKVEKMIETPLNVKLFDEIYEMIQVKNRLDQCLEVFDTISQLASHEVEIRTLIEEGNITGLKSKCIQLSETLAILFTLPKLNSNYEKAEIIVNLIVNYLQDLTHLALLSSDEKNHLKLADYYEILNILKKEAIFSDILSQHKIPQKQKEAILKITTGGSSN